MSRRQIQPEPQVGSGCVVFIMLTCLVGAVLYGCYGPLPITSPKPPTVLSKPIVNTSSDSPPVRTVEVPHDNKENVDQQYTNSHSNKTVHVSGHYRDGKWVQPHDRSPPRR